MLLKIAALLPLSLSFAIASSAAIEKSSWNVTAANMVSRTSNTVR